MTEHHEHHAPRAGDKGAILGSTPHELLHLSDRPVLVVSGG